LKIAVLGAGAIGSVFAALLKEGGEEVRLLTRTGEQADYISKHGLKIADSTGVRVVKIPVQPSRALFNTPDLILVAVKSYDTAEAARSILPSISQDTTILTIQNGLGNIETLAGIVGGSRVVGGVTTQASTLLKTGEVFHAAKGVTVVGELSGEFSERVLMIAETFSRCGIEVEVTSKIHSAVWLKTLVNAGINPLSALTGLKNGQLLEIPEVREFMVQAVLEGVRVAERLKVDLGGVDPVELMLKIAETTYHNRSSMLQDVLRGKRTEIEAVNGALASLGRSLGVETPVNKWLAEAVEDLQKISTQGVERHMEIEVESRVRDSRPLRKET